MELQPVVWAGGLIFWRMGLNNKENELTPMDEPKIKKLKGENNYHSMALTIRVSSQPDPDYRYWVENLSSDTFPFEIPNLLCLNAPLFIIFLIFFFCCKFSYLL